MKKIIIALCEKCQKRKKGNHSFKVLLNTSKEQVLICNHNLISEYSDEKS